MCWTHLLSSSSLEFFFGWYFFDKFLRKQSRYLSLVPEQWPPIYQPLQHPVQLHAFWCYSESLFLSLQVINHPCRSADLAESMLYFCSGDPAFTTRLFQCEKKPKQDAQCMLMSLSAAGKQEHTWLLQALSVLAWICVTWVSLRWCCTLASRMCGRSVWWLLCQQSIITCTMFWIWAHTVYLCFQDLLSNYRALFSSGNQIDTTDLIHLTSPCVCVGRGGDRLKESFVVFLFLCNLPGTVNARLKLTRLLQGTSGMKAEW